MKKIPVFRHGPALLAGVAAAATVAGFSVSGTCGVAVLLSGTALWTVSAGLEHLHRRQLQALNEDLEELLNHGTPLPIDLYREGELSILASQMEKVTLRLTESAERTRQEKANLADALANISHQLRTPMTAMNLAVTMLRTPDLEQRRRMELTAELRSQLTRMDWLVEALLKISKLDAGTAELSAVPIPVRSLISRAAEPLAIPMDLRDQKLEIVCGEEQICADLSWTAEALGNLLKNCMEHTPRGGTVSVSRKF